jgi:large subunit ribosomal protein L9
MKVILISEIANLGKIGDVINVKPGYAKNFLVPQEKAITFSKSNYKAFEEKKDEFEKKNEESLKQAKELKEKIIGNDIIIIENSSDDGRLYGSVSPAVIASKINEKFETNSISRTNVILQSPIKEIGVYNADLQLHSEVSFKLRIIVTRNELEIEALLKQSKENEKSKQKEKEDN